MASIITQVNQLVDYYPTSQVVQVGQTFSFTATATLSDAADITNITNINNISIQWQVSQNNGSTWSNLSVGSDITITTTTEQFITTPVTYYRKSVISISNTTFTQNLYQYRAVISYIGATNTPVNMNSILLVVSPQIIVSRQVGTGDDTLRTKCYKTSDVTTGKIKVEVGASTTAATSLSYSWEINLGDPATWHPINNVIQSYVVFLKNGTVSNSSKLELERCIFYNTVGFRCRLNGIYGETEVVTTPHYVYMEDVPVSPVIETSTYNLIEDTYGNIPDRQIYSDPIQSVTINTLLDVARNTGINGDLTLIYQRKNPGSLVWDDVGTSNQINSSTALSTYTQFPSSTPSYIENYYTSPPLRRDVDNGARYRLKISSSALFTLNGSTKTLVPYYSGEILLNVYRAVNIVNQPVDTNVYPNESASFSVGVSVTSGNASDVTYQWQYNTQNISTGWVNVPNTSPYSGVTSDLLIVNPVPANPSYRFFRCILSVPGQLSTVTTNVAKITILTDYFLSISSINDVYGKEFDNILFQVQASSASQRQITYQWQKSTNYNRTTGIGTWNNITNQTTNSYNILSAATTDTGYYRLRLTSFGGTISYSNVVYVSITAVTIQILKNIITTLSVLEGVPNAYTFECEGFSTVNTPVSYQWQFKRTSDPSFLSIGTGFNNSVDTDKIYAPRAFDRITDTGSKIRCRMTANGVPFDVFTNECTITVNRKFSYFADVAIKTVSLGSNLLLDLNPSWTGGTPSFMWQESTNGGTTWTDLNQTDSSLIIPAITNAFNNRQYRCRFTLTSINQIEYTRNGVTTLSTTATDTNFTLPITISVVATSTKPTYYSLQTQKTGAAIGTVICVAKPPGYVENSSATTDDVDRWAVAVTGSLTTSNTSSVVTSGSVYNANKPAWTNSSYTSPRWLSSNDRFSGYIEMRGQYLRASEFPELARIFGTTYGGTITGSYPRYNTSDIFRMPNLYAKKLFGTGNVNNNQGSTSITPVFAPDGTSGGDKNIPGTVGGLYNYVRSAQLPPGSPGVSGELDGTAGVTTPTTYNIGSYRSSGIETINEFAQPTFSGTVSWSTPLPVEAFTDTPLHVHTGVSVAWRSTAGISGADCQGAYPQALTSGTFRDTTAADGQLENGPTTDQTGLSHGHTVDSGASGTFDIVRDGGMNISDTTFRILASSRSVLDNSLRIYLRNNEEIPLNSPYFRLKYMIKAY